MKKILMCLFVVFFSTASFAAPVNQIIFFGDSLTDNGNLYAIAKQPLSPPYCQGRFSNGATWAEVLGQYYAANRGYKIQNFAIGGAITMTHDKQYFQFDAPALFEQEIYGYLMKTMFQDRSTTLATVWIGANDYLYDYSPDKDLQALANQVVAKLISNLDVLRTQGVQHFMVVNLPDLSRAPYVVEHHRTAHVQTLITLHNQALGVALANWQIKYPTVRVKTIDAYAFLEDVMTNTATYNQTYQIQLTNLTDACWMGGLNALGPMPFAPMDKIGAINSTPLCPSLAGRTYNGYQVCSNPDQHLFWDEVHPTAVMHALLANLVLKDLQAHPEVLA